MRGILTPKSEKFVLAVDRVRTERQHDVRDGIRVRILLGHRPPRLQCLHQRNSLQVTNCFLIQKKDKTKVKKSRKIHINSGVSRPDDNHLHSSNVKMTEIFK